MAQANLTVIGNAFASLAHEVPLLSNHPIVGIGAQLTQLGNAQQQMLQQLNQIQQQLATAQRDITRNEHNAFARHCNGNAASPDTELVPLVNANNQAVPGFPATLGDLRTITGAQIDQLLGAYGLPMGGAVPVRRYRLARHIGKNLV